MLRLLLTASLCLVVAPALAGADGRSGWERRKARLLDRPGLVRLYTFEDASAGGGLVRNAASDEGALRLDIVPFAGAPEERLTTIEGRWPGKPAVRIDRGVFSAEPFAVGSAGFTVSVWFRKNGPGALRGNGGSTDGTIVSIGGGYWDGFRVTTSYPANTFGFEIGRPQPSSSAGFFHAGPLPDGAWHHLCAAWDGRVMRLWLNGLPAGRMEYAGAFTPAPRFQIGYADAGWGSVKLDVDEVAVFERGLEPRDLLELALDGPAPAGALAMLSAAAASAERGAWRDAAARYAGIVPMKGLSPEVRALARAGLAQCRRRAGDAAGALVQSEALALDPAVPERFRVTARAELLEAVRDGSDALQPATLRALLAADAGGRDRALLRLALAGALRARGQAAGAQTLETAALRDPALTPAERLAVAIRVGHALRAEGRHARARAVYGAAERMPGATPDVRAYLRLLAAHTLAAEKRYAAARSAYAALLRDPALLMGHALEARESLREVERLAAGRPARLPSDTRVALPAFPRPGVELWVAPGGSDAAPGTKQRPLATFAGAVRALRALRAKGGIPAGGAAVTFRGGDYPLHTTARLERADSGTAARPIVFRAATGERPRFLGGVTVRGLAPASGAALERLPAEARGRVLRADLRAQGIGDLGALAPHGFGAPASPVVDLFVDGKPMTLARWPNQGWATTGRIVEAKTPEGGFAFAYEGDRPARWTGAKDGWLYGYWSWLWADYGLEIADIETASRTIRTRRQPAGEPRSGMPYIVLNLIEELDSPGEWYLDREEGALYLWPPAGWSDRSRVRLSLHAAPFVEMRDVAHVRLERLAFEEGRADGIVVEGGERVLIAGCTVARMGGTAVTIKGGRNHGVFGCHLHTLGRGGTSVAGGDRKTLTPSGHFVENCRIHDFSRWDRTYTPAVWTDGVGTRIAHNHIHHTPGHAMRLEGNDHLVGWNLVHDVVTETDDQGAVDIFYNPSYRGIVIRNNVWRRIGDGRDERMRAGVRLDDAICGVLITRNVFERASEGYFGGVQIHGGKDNMVDNNLFVDCKFGVSFSRWGAERWRRYLESEDFRRATRETVDIARPPYSTRYPDLARLRENPDVNVIWRNVAVRCGAFLTRDGGIQRAMDNVAARSAPPRLDPRTGFTPFDTRDVGPYPHPLRGW